MSDLKNCPICQGEATAWTRPADMALWPVTCNNMKCLLTRCGGVDVQAWQALPRPDGAVLELARELARLADLVHPDNKLAYVEVSVLRDFTARLKQSVSVVSSVLVEQDEHGAVTGVHATDHTLEYPEMGTQEEFPVYDAPPKAGGECPQYKGAGSKIRRHGDDPVEGAEYLCGMCSGSGALLSNTVGAVEGHIYHVVAPSDNGPIDLKWAEMRGMLRDERKRASEAARIAYMAGHNDTVEGVYGDPDEVAEEICLDLAYGAASSGAGNAAYTNRLHTQIERAKRAEMERDTAEQRAETAEADHKEAVAKLVLCYADRDNAREEWQNWKWRAEAAETENARLAERVRLQAVIIKEMVWDDTDWTPEDVCTHLGDDVVKNLLATPPTDQELPPYAPSKALQRAREVLDNSPKQAFGKDSGVVYGHREALRFLLDWAESVEREVNGG